MHYAGLVKFLTNTPLERYPKLSSTYLLCNCGKKFYTWPNLRSGQHMQCIKQQESLLLIWVSRRQNGFIGWSCFREWERIFGRIRGCTLLCTSPWKRLSTSQLLSIRESYSPCARWAFASLVDLQFWYYPQNYLLVYRKPTSIFKFVS